MDPSSPSRILLLDPPQSIILLLDPPLQSRFPLLDPPLQSRILLPRQAPSKFRVRVTLMMMRLRTTEAMAGVTAAIREVIGQTHVLFESKSVIILFSSCLF